MGSEHDECYANKENEDEIRHELIIINNPCKKQKPYYDNCLAPKVKKLLITLMVIEMMKTMLLIFLLAHLNELNKKGKLAFSIKSCK